MPIRRVLRKIKIGKKIRKNRLNPNRSIQDLIDDWGPITPSVGAKLAKRLNAERGKGKNSPWKLTGIRQGDEEKEAWRRYLSGLLSEKERKLWRESLDREIERKGGYEVAQAHALEQWSRKPEEERERLRKIIIRTPIGKFTFPDPKQKTMEEWLKKHGRAEEWEKKRGQRK